MEKEVNNLQHLIDGCLRSNPVCQKDLYRQFYGYAMKICLLYTSRREEAAEILNDAFLKVFTRLETFDRRLSFKTWLRRILINAAIDYHRKNHHLPVFENLSNEIMLSEEMELPNILPETEVLPILQKLSPAYRIVFNLYVMEEYSHQEIAEILNISQATSRSNLARAIQNLKSIMNMDKKIVSITK